LEVVNGAVAFNNSFRRKTGILKVSVHVRREHKTASQLGSTDF
jgi:hypothetical protein